MTVVAGFDNGAFPSHGMSTMSWLKANTNLTWTAYYLDAPNHPISSWSGNYDALAADGWSVSPIYVGQQDPITSIGDLGVSERNPSVAQGTIDGTQATEEAYQQGISLGTIIYLDLENPDLGTLEQAYVKQWCATVASLGFTPGVYVDQGYSRQRQRCISHSEHRTECEDLDCPLGHGCCGPSGGNQLPTNVAINGPPELLRRYCVAVPDRVHPFYEQRSLGDR